MSYPAAKAIDGNTADPEGSWLTERNTPKSAWLQLSRGGMQPVRGIYIFHQKKPQNYRSVDYVVACWSEGRSETVAEVKDNDTVGWRGHLLEPVMTDKIRLK